MSDKLNFQADVSKMLDIVVNSLYSEKQIFLRELISNASDACDKLKYMALTHPDIARESGEMKIWITPDAEKNTLTVADNGIGMNRDDLINHLGTIAKSGTADFVKNASDNGSAVDLIGQFGVGFYSAFMVADKVEILTRRAGEDKAWFWVSNGVDGFEIREAEKKTNGTEIKLFLKQDEKKLHRQHLSAADYPHLFRPHQLSDRAVSGQGRRRNRQQRFGSVDAQQGRNYAGTV